MGNRVFTGVVLVIWAASMSWLIGAKIMPAFVQGRAPSTGLLSRDPVCWTISVGGQQVGWAAYQVVPGAERTREIHSRVKLEDVPFDQLAPTWMAKLVDSLGEVRIDTRSRTVLDPMGQLATFDTGVQLNDMPAAIRMAGVVRGGSLHLRLNYGESIQRFEYPWQDNGSLASDLAPDPKLIGVSVGLRWQREVYNPFAGPNGAIELVQAEVVCEEPLFVDGALVNTRRIEFRNLSDVGVSTRERCRAKLWVTDDGRVVRQEVNLMNVRLRFDRMSDEHSAGLAADLLDLSHYATTTTPQLPARSMPDDD